MYGAAHKAARKRFVQRMKRGEVFYCWRPTCPRPNEPIDPRYWDLGHVDPELRSRFGHRWPEHPSCNRATLPRMLAKARGEAESHGPATVTAGNGSGGAHDCRVEFAPGAVCGVPEARPHSGEYGHAVVAALVRRLLQPALSGLPGARFDVRRRAEVGR